MSKESIIVKKSKRKERKSRISKSGKWRNLRHMIESMIIKNRNITQEEVDAAVKKEFPVSKYITNSIGTHWPWYYCHIISKGRFTQIEAPSWAKGLDVKKEKKAKDIPKKEEKKKDKIKKKDITEKSIFKNYEKEIDQTKKLIKKSKLKVGEIEPSEEELSKIAIEDGEE